MKRVKPIRAAGRAIELTAALAGAPPCIPDPTGLFWFSETTGDFTEAAEAAYFISPEPDPFDSAGPLIAVARVLGETCGGVVWSWIWTPEPLPDPPPEGATLASAPAVLEDGASLLIYPAPGYGAGELAVSAECAGRAFGPILLVLLPLAVSSECCPEPVAGESSAVLFGGKLVGHFRIDGKNLQSLRDGGLSTSWTTSTDGTPVEQMYLLGSPLAASLVLDDTSSNNPPTIITVRAELSWACPDGPHTSVLTWQMRAPEM